MRLLISESNGRLQTVVADALRAVGYGVDVAKSAAELRSAAAVINYDLVILDANLLDSDGTGSGMVRVLRREGVRVPILVTTGNSTVDQRVEILDCGAADCLVKPFNNRELLARVRALLRRPPRITKSFLRMGNIEAHEVEVRCFDKPVDLRLKERRLFAILLRHNGGVVAKEMLVGAFSDHAVSVNAIEALISRVRRRLRAVQSGIVIQTVHGLGYRLANTPASQSLAPTGKESAAGLVSRRCASQQNRRIHERPIAARMV
jgi:DNA-binding response OmpR family regulator